MKHRAFGTMLAIGLLLFITPSTAKGESDIIEISDAAGLAAVVDDLSGHYKLTTDIELEAAWTPITDLAEDPSFVFTGIFDGNGHTIRNLFIKENTDFASLIGNISNGAEVRNLRVELGTQGASSTYDASGLVYSMDGGLIQNCSVSGKVINNEPDDCNAGALIAYMSGGKVSGCYSEGSVSGGCAGGLIGYIEGGTVEDCYSLAEIAGTYTAGGLAGCAENAVISRCYAAGTVSVTEMPGDSGGFLGIREDGCNLTGCFYQTLSGTPNGIGTDHNFSGSGTPEGKDKSKLTSGSPLNADWDMDIWYFSTGVYPQLQWAKTETKEPLAPPSVSDISYSESEEAGSCRIQFPAVDKAVAYQINIYDQSAVQTKSARYEQTTTASTPLYSNLFTPTLPESANISIPLDDMLTEAAKADVALHPQKTAFSYSVSITAIGSGNTMGVSSDQMVLPEMQRLTRVEMPKSVVCERGDALTELPSLFGIINDQKVSLPIRWAYPYVMPSTADFLGRRTYEAPLTLPIRVLNPDGYMARQTVESYDTQLPPQNLTWDSATPGKATWELPDDPGSAVIVCLLDKNKNPVGEEKIVPRQVEQSYDFNEAVQKLGTGRYYFRVKTKASADGYLRESAWVTIDESFPYTALTGDKTSSDSNQPGKGNNNVQTGDDSNTEGWIALILLGMGGWIVSVLYTRKNHV